MSTQGVEALPELPDHPEPHSMTWTALETRAIEKYGQACYEAGRAAAPAAPTLPEPVAWTRHGMGESEWWSRGPFSARKESGKWVLREDAYVLRRCDYLQDAMEWAVILSPITKTHGEAE